MSLSYPEVLTAAARLVRTVSIPLREPSSARPTFWSPTMLAMKCRPVAATSGWLNYLTLTSGQGPAPQNYCMICNYFIATGLNNPATSGLQYRFLVNGDFLPAQWFGIPQVDENVERVNTPNPWPAQRRRIFIYVPNGQQLNLQVNNTGGISQLAYAALFGWYFPNLGNYGREAFNGSGFIAEDTVRDVHGR